MSSLKATISLDGGKNDPVGYFLPYNYSPIQNYKPMLTETSLHWDITMLLPWHLTHLIL
jgi:hypothetical protein